MRIILKINAKRVQIFGKNMDDLKAVRLFNQSIRGCQKKKKLIFHGAD